MQWMDTLRGSAIVLVMLWHAPAIPVLFDWEIPSWLRAANNFFLPFRMPTLMFLSGLLLPRSLGKGLRNYLVGKFQMLVWPYVLWCLIYFVQYGAPAPLYIWRVWYATGYLWFLCFITIYYVVAPFVTRWLPMWLTPWLCVIVSMLMWTSVEIRLFYFASFFFFGYWFARDGRFLHWVRGWRLVVLAVIASGWGVVSTIHGLAVAFRSEFTLFSMCGVLTLCWLATHVRGRFNDALAFIGRNSLVYYVAHFPVMSAIVLGVLALDLPRNPIIWLPNLVVALLVCSLLARYRRRPWLGWLFEMPEPLIAWAKKSQPQVTAQQRVAPDGDTDVPGRSGADGPPTRDRSGALVPSPHGGDGSRRKTGGG